MEGSGPRSRARTGGNRGGGVAVLRAPRASEPAHRERHDRAGRLHQHDRRSGFRRHAENRAHRLAEPVAIPKRASR